MESPAPAVSYWPLFSSDAATGTNKAKKCSLGGGSCRATNNAVFGLASSMRQSQIPEVWRWKKCFLLSTWAHGRTCKEKLKCRSQRRGVRSCRGTTINPSWLTGELLPSHIKDMEIIPGKRSESCYLG